MEAAARGHADVLRLLLAPTSGVGDEDEEVDVVDDDDDDDDVAIQVGGGVNTVGVVTRRIIQVVKPTRALESSAWFHP